MTELTFDKYATLHLNAVDDEDCRLLLQSCKYSEKYTYDVDFKNTNMIHNLTEFLSNKFNVSLREPSFVFKFTEYTINEEEMLKDFLAGYEDYVYTLFLNQNFIGGEIALSDDVCITPSKRSLLIWKPSVFKEQKFLKVESGEKYVLHLLK